MLIGDSRLATIMPSTPGNSKTGGFVIQKFLFFLLFLIVWLGLWLLGIAGAMPYGGTNAPLKLAIAITWGVLIWVGFKLLSALSGFFIRPSQEANVVAGDAALSRAKTVAAETEQPMILCPNCNTETNANEKLCMWCSKVVGEAVPPGP